MRSTHPLDLPEGDPPEPTPSRSVRTWPWLALSGALAVPAASTAGVAGVVLAIAAFSIAVWALARMAPEGGGLREWRQ